MSALFLAGQKFNLLERSPSIVVTDEDPDNPKANLYDGRPLRPFKFATAPSGDRNITIQNQILLNSRLNLWSGGLPTSWTKIGPGTVTEETVDVVEGSAAKIDATAGGTRIEQAVTVRAGERLQFIGYLHGASGGTAIVQVQNRRNGKWLKSDLTWAATEQNLWTSAAASYTNFSSVFQVESYAALGADLVSLKFYFYVASGVGFFDSFILIPAVDFLSVHGHNYDDWIQPEIYSSSDNFVTDIVQEAVPVAYQPSFYWWRSAGPLYREWWRLKGAIPIAVGGGSPATVPGLGELVLGQATQLAASAAHPARVPWSTSYDRAQVRHESDAGDTYAFNRGAWRRRVVTLPYSVITEAKLKAIVDEIRNRCEDGVHPLVVVPDSGTPHVLHGRIDKSFETREVARDAVALAHHEHDLVVRESAFPIFAA